MHTALDIVRPGAAISRVRVPHHDAIPSAQPAFYANSIEPGRVFDRVVGLDGVPDGYRAMDSRESIEVMIRP